MQLTVLLLPRAARVGWDTAVRTGLNLVEDVVLGPMDFGKECKANFDFYQEASSLTALKFFSHVQEEDTSEGFALAVCRLSERCESPSNTASKLVAPAGPPAFFTLD